MTLPTGCPPKNLKANYFLAFNKKDPVYIALPLTGTKCDNGVTAQYLQMSVYFQLISIIFGKLLVLTRSVLVPAMMESMSKSYKYIS